MGNKYLPQIRIMNFVRLTKPQGKLYRRRSVIIAAKLFGAIHSFCLKCLERAATVVSEFRNIFKGIFFQKVFLSCHM